MKRWCEIYANAEGRLIVILREIVDGEPIVYGDFISEPAPLHPAVETSYRSLGPFGVECGSIPRVRVVS